MTEKCVRKLLIVKNTHHRIRIIHTMDAMDNQWSGQDDYTIDDSLGTNPATGPLFVEGAKAGDTIKVSVLSICPTADCSMTVEPGFGVFAEEIHEAKGKPGDGSDGLKSAAGTVPLAFSGHWNNPIQGRTITWLFADPPNNGPQQRLINELYA